MKSKFMKSMKLLWQISPVEEDTNKKTQEEENSQQNTEINSALTKEYAQALTQKQIPQPLLDKIADLINDSIPDLIRQSIDKEVEKQNIYNHLLEPFTDYIRFICDKIQTEGFSQWKQDEVRLKDQIKELNEYIHELSSKQEESQNQYLSAERQKRALGERVHELEMRIVTFEAEKEQSDTEKSALINKLKVAAVQEKNRTDELEALQEQKQRLEKDLENARQIDPSLPEKLQETIDRADKLQQQLDAAIAHQQEISCQYGALQTEKAGLQKESDQMKTENKELHESLTTVLHAKDDAVKQAVERENMLNRKMEAVLTEKQKLTELYASTKEEIDLLNEQIMSLSQELEKYKSIDAELKETSDKKTHLEKTLVEAEKQIQTLQQEIETKEQKNNDLQSSLNTLEDRITHLKENNDEISVLLKEKSSTLEAQQLLLKDAEVCQQNMAELKHQLLVANDMLTAVKAQRQDLFAEVEKEKNSRTEIQQKLLIAENTVRQLEHDRQIDRKNIKALMSEIEDLKEELKKNDRDKKFLDEPEELDWLVPTRPDTPEEIARKKAEKKLQEKEWVEEEKKEIKPDPSQMSLW